MKMMIISLYLIITKIHQIKRKYQIINNTMNNIFNIERIEYAQQYY